MKSATKLKHPRGLRWAKSASTQTPTTGFVDIHCHILPSVDDGAKDINASLELLKQAEQAGITDIILTPHYVSNSKYGYDHAARQQILDVLEIGKQQAHINVNLHLGSEIYLDPTIPAKLRAGVVSPLANSRYLLVEFPVDTEDYSAKSVLGEFITMGYTPIIAHPERYKYFQDNPDKLTDYLEMGCQLQGDYQSLFGHLDFRFGPASRKLLTQLLKEHKITYLASDIHHPTESYNLAATIKKVEKIVKDPTYVSNLLIHNPHKIVL